jgi:hypothetical protein
VELLGKRVVLYGFRDDSPRNGAVQVVKDYNAEKVRVIE